MKRIKLKDRVLPCYSKGEEIMNMVTHISGGGMSILLTIICLWKILPKGQPVTVVGCSVYCLSMITVYCISSIYHGLHVSTGKKVMQVIDHCMIYFLIAGTYTPILLIGFVPAVPIIGWGLLGCQWLLAAIAITLTAIDLKRFQIFSMVCYILMGWAIIFFLPIALKRLTYDGFILLLSGGIAYTLGAILFGIGVKVKWMHSVFHIFVVIGSVLQFFAIYLYLL